MERYKLDNYIIECEEKDSDKTVELIQAFKAVKKNVDKSLNFYDFFYEMLKMEKPPFNYFNIEDIEEI